MENKRFLLITSDIVKFDPTLEDEISNPGSLIINYSYFDKFSNDYYDLMPEKFLKEVIINDLKDLDLFNQNEIVLWFIFNHIIKNFERVGI